MIILPDLDFAFTFLNFRFAILVQGVVQLVQVIQIILLHGLIDLYPDPDPVHYLQEYIEVGFYIF